MYVVLRLTERMSRFIFQEFYWHQLVNVRNISSFTVEAHGVTDQDDTLGWYYATAYGCAGLLGMIMNAHIELLTTECGCRVRSMIMYEVFRKTMCLTQSGLDAHKVTCHLFRAL